MLDAVNQFQEQAEAYHRKIDEYERQIKMIIPEAAPILDVCERLHRVSEKYYNAVAILSKIEGAQRDLMKAISSDLVPTAYAVKNAVNATGKIRIDSLRLPDVTDIPDEQTITIFERTPTPKKTPRRKSEPSPKPKSKPIQKETKKKTTAKKKGKTSSNFPPYREITEEEYGSIAKREKYGITLQEIRKYHLKIYNYFYPPNAKEPNQESLTHRIMETEGLNINKSDIMIRLLKLLNRITFDKYRTINSCVE